jgi:hypothetical protein
MHLMEWGFHTPPYMEIYFDHIKKGMTMNGTSDKGPSSKVQWKGEVL